jgi:hypothetical protein
MLTIARHAVTDVNIEQAKPIINTKAKPLTEPVPTKNNTKATNIDVILESKIVAKALSYPK